MISFIWNIQNRQIYRGSQRPREGWDGELLLNSPWVSFWDDEASWTGQRWCWYNSRSTKCHWVIHFTMVIFMLCDFHLSTILKKSGGRGEENLLRDFPGGAVDKNLSANAGDTVWILVQEDPTCLGTTKSMQHNYLCLKPMLCKKKSRCDEKPVHCSREYPARCVWRKPFKATRIQHSQKQIRKKIF